MPLGCFKDQKSPRVLNAHKMDLPSVNSVQSCLKYCYKLGHSYGGLALVYTLTTLFYSNF